MPSRGARATRIAGAPTCSSTTGAYVAGALGAARVLVRAPGHGARPAPTTVPIGIHCDHEASLSAQPSVVGSHSKPLMSGHASSSTADCTAPALKDPAASIWPRRTDVSCIFMLKSDVPISSPLSLGGHTNWDRRYGALGMYQGLRQWVAMGGYYSGAPLAPWPRASV